ncbi:MAG: aldehyde dehydrogenase family protein [Bacteroidales bacterium]
MNEQMKVFREEQFGPVIPIVTYHHLDEALDYVINSNYGQQASIFGKAPDKIAKLLDTLVNQVCRVNINNANEVPIIFLLLAEKTLPKPPYRYRMPFVFFQSEHWLPQNPVI